MRLLVTGAAGQLGTDLTLLARAEGDDVVALTSADLDVTDRAAVDAAIDAHRPEVVVNAAAWTAVDACEGDEPRALRANALAVRWLGAACRRVDAHLVQVSTDYVFDGTKIGAYHEFDEPAPATAYGRTKLAGEREALASGATTSVVRTAWLGGVHGHNMVKTVLGLRDRRALAFVDDQRGSPTFTADLAAAIRALAEHRVAGVFHVANRGEASWFQLAREVLQLAGADPEVVAPIATHELDPPRPARRPANSVLDDLAWRSAGFEPLPHYRRSLEQVVATLLAQEPGGDT